MRIAGTLPSSLVNGEGIRFVVFLQGCMHHCLGCQNPDTWDPNGGQEVTPQDIADAFLRRAHLLDGITLSGGDPFFQQEACVELLKLLPANTNVWIYTGFTYDKIKDTELAKMANVIVDGPFIRGLRCEGRYYGSYNQRIIHVKT